MKNSRKIKILLVRHMNKNYGDTIIADCTEYLIKKALGKKADQYTIINYAYTSDDIEQIKYVDAVVFAGGGLIKFKAEDFYKRVAEMIETAQKYNVPVFLNAVGVEGHDEADERCLMISDALNKPCVKGISVRDDIDLLKDSYIKNPDIRIRNGIDPAVWTPQAYGITRRPQDEECIGLGIAREMLFADYDLPQFDRQFMLDFWKDTALALEAKGLKWKLFTNGLDSDECFADDVLEYIGHGEKLAQPNNAATLVKNISYFTGMIATRMHSNIVAFSLGIPSIGLVWNDKLKMWGENIGCPERFLESKDISAENAVSALELAMKQGSRKLGFFKKRSSYRELKKFLKANAAVRSENAENIDFSENILAAALGGVEYRYKLLNCVQQIGSTLSKGVKNVEVDVRVTSDGKLVCVNGWSKDTFKKLGIEYNKSLSKGMTLDDFLTLDYHDRFPTASFKDFVFAMSEHSRINAVIDVGMPPKMAVGDMFAEISKSFRHFSIAPERIIIRLQREEDVALWKEQDFDCRIAYFFPDIEDDTQRAEKYAQVIDYCKAENIDIISLSNKAYTDKTAKLLNDNAMKACVFTYTKPCDIIDAVKKGAYLVGSHYYFSDYINSLTSEE